MPPSGPPRSFDDMKRTLLIALLAVGLIALALGGWTVQGIRWTLRGREHTVQEAADDTPSDDGTTMDGHGSLVAGRARGTVARFGRCCAVDDGRIGRRGERTHRLPVGERTGGRGGAANGDSVPGEGGGCRFT